MDVAIIHLAAVRFVSGYVIFLVGSCEDMREVLCDCTEWPNNCIEFQQLKYFPHNFGMGMWKLTAVVLFRFHGFRFRCFELVEG